VLQERRVRLILEGKQSDAELRRELQDAIAKVRGQIDVQARTPSYGATFGGFGPSGKIQAIEELQAELAQLEDALKNLRAKDA
jgi:hypothetical protein